MSLFSISAAPLIIMLIISQVYMIRIKNKLPAIAVTTPYMNLEIDKCIDARYMILNKDERPNISLPQDDATGEKMINFLKDLTQKTDFDWSRDCYESRYYRLLILRNVSSRLLCLPSLNLLFIYVLNFELGSFTLSFILSFVDATVIACYIYFLLNDEKKVEPILRSLSYSKIFAYRLIQAVFLQLYLKRCKRK